MGYFQFVLYNKPVWGPNYKATDTTILRFHIKLFLFRVYVLFVCSVPSEELI